MSQLIVDEDLFDELLEKATPPEYEVLLEGYGLSQDEEEYFYAIMLVLEGAVQVVKDWLLSDDAADYFAEEDLPVDFFDEVEWKIRRKMSQDFELLILPVLWNFFMEGINFASVDLNILPEVTDTLLLTFASIKHDNYNQLINIMNDVVISLKDKVYSGINDGLDIGEIIDTFEINDLKGKSKFTPQTRAEMTARTEHTDIISRASASTYIDNDIVWVDIVTAGDNRVCAICKELEYGNPYLLEKLIEEDMIPPFHSRCRCKLRVAEPPNETT